MVCGLGRLRCVRRRLRDLRLPSPRSLRPPANCSQVAREEKPVGPRLVAVDQLAAGELLMDAGAGGTHPRMCAFNVAVERQGQEARVQLLAVEGTRVAPYPLVIAVRLDFLSDLVSVGAEEVDRNLQVSGLVHLDQSVERDPAQCLRVGVMEAAGTPFPELCKSDTL